MYSGVLLPVLSSPPTPPSSVLPLDPVFPCAQERIPAFCHLTYLTVPPREAWRAITLVFANVVKASTTIVTGTRGAGVWLSWRQKIPITVKCYRHQPLQVPTVPETRLQEGVPEKQVHGGQGLASWILAGSALAQSMSLTIHPCPGPAPISQCLPVKR